MSMFFLLKLSYLGMTDFQASFGRESCLRGQYRTPICKQRLHLIHKDKQTIQIFENWHVFDEKCNMLLFYL